MTSRNVILFILYKTFGKIQPFNILVMMFYRYIIFPFIKIYLHLFYPNLVRIAYRNSVSSIENFNAFLSDLDVTLIIRDDSNPTPIIKSYLNLKKYLIMLDYPEIYFEKEQKILDSFQKNQSNKLVELCWNIRKINWNLDSLDEQSDKLNTIKKNRSIRNSFRKILQSNKENSDYLFDIEVFSYINEFIPPDYSEKNLCYWSMFLETNKKNHIKIMLTTKQYYFLNSLMPGEVIARNVKDDISAAFFQNKTCLELHELYLSKSSVRLKEAIGHNPAPVQEWINHLEKKLGLTN